jgi:amino acid adenylation domain-containing protein
MNEVENGKFSCFIIGGGTLPIRCAEILLRAGHKICAIASSDKEVKRWAKENSISHLSPGANLAEQISEPFDYLFSIVNEHILREDILLLPRRMAINYHDAPLPKYAGTHATSWALLNGESVHGISWHLITETVDAGDVLKQEPVEISERDTALTLNTKCYEAAIKAFSELVADLSTGNVVVQKQNLAERTFFPRFKRPANGGVISWNKPAAEISRLVRALNFGNHPNPLGTAKFAVGDDFLIASEIEILDSKAASPAGTVNEIGEDFLKLSTADFEVALRNVFELDGRPISIADLVTKFDLREGSRLPNLEDETLGLIETAYKNNCRNEAFWVKKLAAIEPAVPPLANSIAVSNRPSYETVPLSLDSEIANFLKKSGENNETSDLLIAAFGAFLARLNGVENFDVAYRSEKQPETLELKKLFVEQVPLRFQVKFNQNFTEFLQSFKKEIEATDNHQIFARDLIARFPQLRSIAESNNKFSLPAAVAKVKTLDDYHPTVGNELTLAISESEDESNCFWIYDRKRIDAENVNKLTDCFRTFLRGIAADAESQIAFLPLLTETESRRVLIEWNENRRDYPKDSCIHQLFEAQVNRTPEETALIFGDERLTYRELNERSNHLSHYLKKLGVGAETLVGVCVPRSIEMIVGILGILKAGGAYVPLDPAYPKDRLAYMLEDSRAAVVLTKQNLVGELNQERAQIVCLDADWQKIAELPKENPVSSVKPNDLAYVIYTSGSTGKPKGVAIEHRNTVAFLSWANSIFTVEQLKGTLASTSVCFDLSVYEMFAPLSCGGAVILVENVLHLPSAPAAREVTLVNTVPSAITELLRIKGVPASVRTVNLAGEPLKTSLVRQIYELEHIKEVYDLYGPSEDTTYSTYTLRNTEKATIGRPISNTQAYVLDRYLQPVPIGVPGELYLGGDGLARGYLNRPELTDERFIENPFGSEPNARIYKTGDLVRYLPNGEIEYLGRIDNQVKIRGFRIELGEIEARLLAHPAVTEAVVTAREDAPGDKRLAAYFVTESPVKATDLRDYLKQTLPDYMIPAAFVELDEMPLTPNGKIDRKALPAPSSAIAESDRAFVAHRDDVESRLVKIWETILNVNPISVKDDFFELGGHSLQAVRMFAEVEEAFGKMIPLATLFEAGTIEKLAEILRQDTWAERESSIVPIQTNGSKPPFFCVHAKGGNVLFYRDLSKHLGEDQPFYGIQARRLGGRQVGHATVEEMAEFYIKEMKTVQPEGPYFVGGTSFGGLAAFEIAQQLRRRGEKVGLLALFDTGTPDYPKLLPTTSALHLKIYDLISRVQQHRDILLAFNSKEKANYIYDKLQKVKLKYRRKIVNNYKKIARKFYLQAKGTGSIPAKYIQLEDQIWKAGQKYQPQIYDGKMTLFRALIQPLGIEPDPTLGWQPFVSGEIEIHDVPGHHGSITREPYVQVLAEKLTDCLALTQKGAEKLENSQPVHSDRREVSAV